MSKLEKIGMYIKSTGESIDSDIYESIKKEEDNNTIKRLQWLFENDPDRMTFEEVRLLRKIFNKSNTSKVKLEYSDGFYMVANNTENNLSKLSLDTCGFIHLLGFNINKSGVILYKNNKPIKTFEHLRLFFNISERTWSRIKKEIDSLDIIRKETFENSVYLIINPMYIANAYEVTEIKFYCFNKYFKENLSKIDYLYLCKQWGVNL